MRIIFLGTPEYAAPFLRALITHGYTPLAVISQPDRPAGRTQTITPTPVKHEALAHGIEVWQPENINDPAWLKKITDAKPDLLVTVAFGQILSRELLTIPPKGCINVHPSMLPKYRGAAPLQETILHGDTESAVTIIRMDEKMDHGDIIAQQPFAVDSRETMPSLREKTTTIGTALLIDTISQIAHDTTHYTPQDHTNATFTRLLSRDAGKIDPTHPAQEIDRQIRALNPWPGTWTTWQGKRIKIIEAHPTTSTSPDISPTTHPAGTLFAEHSILYLQCGDHTSLAITRLQLEGKKETSGQDFARGYLK